MYCEDKLVVHVESLIKRVVHANSEVTGVVHARRELKRLLHANSEVKRILHARHEVNCVVHANIEVKSVLHDEWEDKRQTNIEPSELKPTDGLSHQSTTPVCSVSLAVSAVSPNPTASISFHYDVKFC